MELTKDLDLDSGVLAAVDVLSKDGVISSLLPGDRVELQQVEVLLLDHLHSLSKHQRDAVSLPAYFREGLAKHLSIQEHVFTSFHHN